MEKNSPGSEEHVRIYDVTDEVLEPLKNDMSRAVQYLILGFDACGGVNEENVAVEGTMISLAWMDACIAPVMQ